VIKDFFFIKGTDWGTVETLTVWQLCLILVRGLKWGNGPSFVTNDGETSHTVQKKRGSK
jgi:hypothetical protein